LANKHAFKTARQSLAGQEEVISRETKPEVAATKMDELVGQYNDLVKEATRKRAEPLMYTVLSAALLPVLYYMMVHFHLLPHQV